MSYTYLLDTYAFIAKRLQEVQQKLVDAGDDDGRTRLSAAGRIEALCEIENYLHDRYDAKLPRRILQQRARFRGCANL